MGMRDNKTIRSNVPEEARMVELLESGVPLPDDDPKTRRGGLNPRWSRDKYQIQNLMEARQKGAIPDKAWERIIQRNPRVRDIFGGITVSPEVINLRSRQEIGQKYFQPGREEVPFQTTEEQEFGLPSLRGNVEQEAVAPKADYQNAYLAAMQAGDLDYARSLSGASGGRDVEGITLVKLGDGRLARVGFNKSTGRDEIIPVSGEFQYQEPVIPQLTVAPGTNIPVTALVPRSQAQGGRVLPRQQEALSPKEVRDISRGVDSTSRYNELVKTFNPKYVGDVSNIVGEAITEAAKRGMGDPGRADWWQAYQAYVNEFRATQFGLTLTKFELAAFNKAQVTPGMHPSVARTNMKRQQAILNRAQAREQKALKSGGYYGKQVEEAYRAPPNNAPTGWKIERIP